MRLSELHIYEKLKQFYFLYDEWFPVSNVRLVKGEKRLMERAVKGGMIDVRMCGKKKVFRFTKYFNRMHKQYSGEPIPEHRLNLKSQSPIIRLDRYK